MEETILIVDKESENNRIDKYLAEVFNGKSRSYIQGLIEKENIKNSEKDDIFTENIGCYHENQMVQLLYWKIKFSIST